MRGWKTGRRGVGLGESGVVACSPRVPITNFNLDCQRVQSDTFRFRFFRGVVRDREEHLNLDYLQKTLTTGCNLLILYPPLSLDDLKMLLNGRRRSLDAGRVCHQGTCVCSIQNEEYRIGRYKTRPSKSRSVLELKWDEIAGLSFCNPNLNFMEGE